MITCENKLTNIYSGGFGSSCEAVNLQGLAHFYLELNRNFDFDTEGNDVYPLPPKRIKYIKKS